MSKKKESPKITLSIKKLAELKNQHEQGTLKDYSKAAHEISQIFSDPNLAQAFKTQEDYKKLAAQYSTSSLKDFQEYFKPLAGIEDYLKKDYSYLSKATEQYVSLAKLAGIESIQEKAKKNLEALTGKASVLDYASELTKAASSLQKSSFMDQIEKQRKTFEQLHKPTMVEIKPNIEHFDRLREINDAIQKKAEEKEKREKALYENSEAQIEKLEIISQYMIQQAENLELQNQILNEQVTNLKLQNEKAEKQIDKIEKQNQLMQEQQEDNRKTSKVAFWTAVASIAIGVIIGIIGIYFSYLLYKWQDISDNKNQKELIQTIKSSSSNQNLIEVMKKQIEESKKTNKLLQKSLPKKQKTPGSDNDQKPSS